eukprot:COSAG01_NODE_48122_length_384_cov_0.438596_1_plen_51_part_10
MGCVASVFAPLYLVPSLHSLVVAHFHTAVSSVTSLVLLAPVVVSKKLTGLR